MDLVKMLKLKDVPSDLGFIYKIMIGCLAIKTGQKDVLFQKRNIGLLSDAKLKKVGFNIFQQFIYFYWINLIYL